MTRRTRVCAMVLIAGWAPATAAAPVPAAPPQLTTPQAHPQDQRRLVLVTIDGVRWREIFRGADRAMLAAELRRIPPGATAAAFFGADAAQARAALMPFLWTTVAGQGQIFGNLDRGSALLVQNPHRKSYPGYAELLSGFVSDVVTGNHHILNPDPTALEWLNGRPALRQSVAVYAFWALFPLILNQPRSQLPVSMGQGAGWDALVEQLRLSGARPTQLSTYDAFVFRAAVRHLRVQQPRVLYLALGDADEWAHADRYDRYLESIHRADAWLAELWAAIEAHPAYSGRTTLLITTDHGRGDNAATWTRHGWDIPGSEHAFAAVLGPGVPARGERADHAPLMLGQIAATAAALLGEDYRAAVPRAAPALPLGTPAAPRR
jgi:hypothetical protein